MIPEPDAYLSFLRAPRALLTTVCMVVGIKIPPRH